MSDWRKTCEELQREEYGADGCHVCTVRLARFALALTGHVAPRVGAEFGEIESRGEIVARLWEESGK
jgi:hypothetical protein